MTIPDVMARASLDALLTSCSPHEVTALRATLRRGRLQHAGAVIAVCRGAVDPPAAPLFDAWLAALPAAITPETHPAAAQLDAWLDAWLARRVQEVRS